MKEYIERDALIQQMADNFRQGVWGGCDCGEYQIAEDTILCAPAADVVERKRGEWVLGHVEPGYFTPGGNRPWVCSECGQVESWHLDRPKTKFCGECGADMREVDHETD
jgi:hypothetical protein